MKTFVGAGLLCLAMGNFASAYSNNCDGSFVGFSDADVNSCHIAIGDVDAAAMYEDQAQFSYEHCYMKYATNDAGPQPVSGQIIKDTANTILNACSPNLYHGEGSYGTNNCESCHVTLNYRN